MRDGAAAGRERDTPADRSASTGIDSAAGLPVRALGWLTDVISEDDALPPPGGARRGEFLDLLGRDLVAMVDEELRGTGLTGAGCPIIEQLVDRYRAAPLERWQRFLEQWVPAAAGRTADGVRALVTARARAGVREWRASGSSSALLPAGALGLLGAAAGAVGFAVPADPVTGLLDAVLRLGPGEPLPAGSRQRLAAGLGADTSTVRVHRSGALPGIAVTAGEHVVLGSHAPAGGTLGADALLAHEVAHAVQQRSRPAPGADSAEAERAADSAALAAVVGGRAARPAGTGLRLASCGGDGGILGGGREVQRLTAEQLQPLPNRPALAIATQPAFAAPPSAGPALGERLESSDPATRAAAIQELSAATGPDGWRLLVLASASPVPEVAAAAEQLVVTRLAQPDFLAWLAVLPGQGTGQLGDLAVGLLARAGEGARVDLEAYRGILRQQLQLLRIYRGELVAARDMTSTGPDTSFRDLEAGLATTDAVQLAGVGRRVSRLLERFTLIRAEVARTDSIAGAAGLSGPMAGLVQAHRQAMLDAAVTIGPEEQDATFAAVLAGMRRFTTDSTRRTVEELRTHVDEARDDLRKFLVPTIGFPPAPQLTAVIPPLAAELDALASRIAAWQPAVTAHPIAVLEDLGRIQPALMSLLARVRLARGAVSLERGARKLETTMPYIEPPPLQMGDSQGFGSFGAGRTILDVRDQQAITADLRTHRDNFALLAEGYERNPAVAEQLAAAEAQGAERTAQRANLWTISQNARYQADLLAAELQLAVAILIVAAWTGGVVGGITTDVLASTGLGEVVLGSWVIAASSVIAEGSAFYLTQRGLDWAVHGGQGDLLPEHWQRDMLLSVGAVAALRGTGRLFEVLAGARPPTTLLAAGRFATTYATLLAYTSIVEPLVRHEPIAGLSTGKFWAGAGETLLMMGAAHVGLAAMRPLTLRVTEPFLRARIESHNVRAERIGADLEALFQGELDPARTRSVIRRSRALLDERVGLLRRIAGSGSPDLNLVEFAELSRLIDVQIKQADSTLLLDAFRVRPLRSGANRFGYEGAVETVRAHFVERGFKVVGEDPRTGLLRMRDPSGQELTFFRMHAGATGADPRRMPSELDLSITKGRAEVDRRATESYQAIREFTDDVPRVARSTGVPPHVIEAVKQHLFLRLHRIAIAPGRAQMQRFDPMYSLARLWLGAYDGVLTTPEITEFRRLMAHEYVEQGLMEAGMPYRSAHPAGWEGDITRPGAGHFGAHDVAPSEHMTDPYAFRRQLGLDPAGQPVPQPGEVWDYDAALRSAFESLAARTGGPYRVVADPAAPHGHRIEAHEPAELGTLDPGRPGSTRVTGAGPAWNSIRAQLTARGLAPREASDLADLLEASGRTPVAAVPVTALTSDQLRQLIPMDTAGLNRVLAIDPALLPGALSLATSPADVLGGRALEALLTRMGQPWVERTVAQPQAPNRRLFAELGRDALDTLTRPLPRSPWPESFSQQQLEQLVDAPAFGFTRLGYRARPNVPISEPGFQRGTSINMGRQAAQRAGRLANATFPDIYGAPVGSTQNEAMELKTVRLPDTTASHFRRLDTAQDILKQHGGRLEHLPQGVPSYLVVDIRQSGQSVAEALADLSTVLRNYGRMGDARTLWTGVRFITGPRSTPVLSPVYQIP